MAYSFKSNLSFGFVYIPITLHLIVKENTPSFKLFDKKTKSKIQYKKTCDDCAGREVSNQNIVKGYEYSDGKYVLFNDEDFEKIKTQRDKNINLDQFINIEEVDPIWYKKSYYIVPTSSDKAYNLLVKAMEQEKKAGIGKTVLGSKESIVLVRAKDGVLILSTLYFKDEIKDIPYNKESISVTTSELKIAKMIIKEMVSPFKPEQYHDEYNKKIQDAIKKKIKGQKIVTPKEKRQNQITDLMKALKTSLDDINKGKKAKPTSKKKISPNNFA